MKKIQRTRKYFAPQNEGSRHKCDHPGCNESGEYKAPKDRRLKEYYWFCLEHVQEYNQKWNYYDGIEEEIEAEAERRNRMRFRWFGSKIKYSFGDEFGNEYNTFREFSAEAMTQVYYTDADRRNLKIMELSTYQEEITVDVVKKQYKQLVKKYHPDVNQGDKNAEEKFKLLGAAYKSLVAKLS